MSTPPKRLILLGCSALALLLVGLRIERHELFGQVYRADGTAGVTVEPYVVRHASATQVGTSLAGLLPEGSEVFPDEATGRVLVRGPAAAQRLAQNAIRSLDQPHAGQEGEPSPGAGSRPTVFTSYRCPPGRIASVAAALQEEFGNLPGVRIVPDGRTSQVLVIAPPEVQERISARFTLAASQQPIAANATAAVGAVMDPPAAPAGAAAIGAALPPSSKSPQPIEIRLGSTTAARIETSLVETLGNQLRPLAASAPDVSAYRLMLKSGEGIDLSINHRSNRVTLVGGGTGVQSMLQLIGALDTAPEPAETSTQLVPLRTTRPIDVQRTIAAIRTAGGALPEARDLEEQRLPLAARLLQPKRTAQAGSEGLAAAQPAAAPAAPQPKAGLGEEEGGGLIGQVDVQMIEGFDVLVIRGHRRDVKQVVDIINQIEKLSAQTEPAIEVFHLRHVDNSALGALIKLVYQEIYAARLGTVSITPLVRPNALLLIGRKESVQKVIEVIKKLDVSSMAGAQHKVFPLKYASAATAQTILQGLYPQRTGAPGAFAGAAAGAVTGGLLPQVTITSDPRANTLIVQAPPREMAEIAALIQQIDTDTTESVNEIRQFQLIHMLADQMALILQNAILAQTAGQQRVGAAGQAGAAFGAPLTSAAAAAGAQGAAAGANRSAMLQFVTVDGDGERRLTSGILSGVQISSNPSANTVIVTGPAKSIGLIAALVKQLDQPPTMRAEIKVFPVERADANALANLLLQLFSPTPTIGLAGGAGAVPQQTAAQGGDTSLIPLRFAIDARTNTIIATGAPADLNVVHAIILRLDRADVDDRESTVRRLKNAPADYVATAITNFLGQELTLERQVAPQLITPLEQIERQVIVVAETVTNSLIISATKRYFPVIEKLIEELDRRPEMVEIQVLIAQVDLNNVDEFGIEMGIQDSVLFDRSVDGVPGFDFNTTSLGNSSAASALATAARTGTQALSNLAMGRANGDAGFGGLVLSASSQSVSVLIRALKSARRLEVLASPKITTLNNQTAYIQVGQEVPQVTGTSQTTIGTQNAIEYYDVGVILQVTPRVSPDGMVVMQVTAIRSDVGPISEGIPIAVSANGVPTLAPRIDSTRAETTVSAADGQTVVLGGLIKKQSSTTSRKVPYLADVPLVGTLFRYDAAVTRRTELLIIMTPTVIKSEEDMNRLKRLEAGRISWCLSDVIDIFGDAGLRSRHDEWRDDEVPVTYPDQKTPPGEPAAAAPGSVGPGRAPPKPTPPPPSADPGANPPMPPMKPAARSGGNPPGLRAEPLLRQSSSRAVGPASRTGLAARIWGPKEPAVGELPSGPLLAPGAGPEMPVSFQPEAPAVDPSANPLRGDE